MTDPFSAALDAAALHRFAALPLAALAGLASSVGPCVAPRYLALATLCENGHALRATAAFVAGIVVATAALGAGGALVMGLLAHAGTIDAALAVAMIAFGVATVWRAAPSCAHRAPLGATRAGGPFVLGAASALVVSPCCTPLLIAFAGLGAFDRDPLFAGCFLIAFAIGHAAPLLFAGSLGGAIARRAGSLAAGTAASTVSGGLMIALGGYYGLLA